MTKRTIIIGSTLACSAVILGALNAHFLKQFFTPDTTQSFDTGVRYQIYHALAILALAGFSDKLSAKHLKKVVWIFLIGILLFSGSIYLLCAFKANGIIGLTGLGILTPIGGLVLITGWIMLIFAAFKNTA